MFYYLHLHLILQVNFYIAKEKSTESPESIGKSKNDVEVDRAMVQY